MFIKLSQTSLSFGEQSDYGLLQLNLKIPCLKLSTQRVSSHACNSFHQGLHLKIRNGQTHAYCIYMNGKTHQNEKV